MLIGMVPSELMRLDGEVECDIGVHKLPKGLRRVTNH